MPLSICARSKVGRCHGPHSSPLPFAKRPVRDPTRKDEGEVRRKSSSAFLPPLSVWGEGKIRAGVNAFPNMVCARQPCAFKRPRHLLVKL